MDKDLLKEWNQLQGLDNKYSPQFIGHKYWKEYILFLEEKILINTKEKLDKLIEYGKMKNNVPDENMTEGYKIIKEK